MYQVIAYYLFTPVADPLAEIAKHKAYLVDRDATARIYISEEGINGQMSIIGTQAEAYMDWVREQEPFREVIFKVQDHHEHTFPRLTVKYRKQLVALDLPVDLSLAGEHVSPQEWARMLKEENKLLLDVRNDYEGLVGHFEGRNNPRAMNLDTSPNIFSS